MKQFLILLRQLIFWLLFFAFHRLLFLIWFYDQVRIEEIPFSKLVLTFFYALKLDIATASYILIFPFILLGIQGFVKAKWPGMINKTYTLLIVLVFILISVAELSLYREWQTKLTYKALVYLQKPEEIIRTVSNFNLILSLAAIVILTVGFYVLYSKFFSWRTNQTYGNTVSKIVFLFVVPAILIVGVRGGFGQIPITVSQSYFSRFEILNQASVNSGYNIAFNIIDYYQIEEQNIFQFMPHEEALSIVEKIHKTEKDTTLSIFTTPTPNIVIIFLESWSGDLIESLGGEPGLTPEFHKLEKEGLLFTNFYTTGNRSQQALASVFSGLPALPITTLTDHPGKYDALPSLIQEIKSLNYYSSFYFGGDLTYGNIKSYLIYNQFDKLIDENDFEENSLKGKLGVHDEGLFNKLLDELGNQPEPFFTATLTLSSHAPYDQPGPRPIDWIDLESDYVNSTWYADKCLGEFFQQAKQKDWYKNTVFVVLSDHSHPSYNNYQWWSFNFRHIPLLFIGGALKEEFRNTTSDHLSANMDLSKTLLKQLNLESSDFKWSKDIFNPYSPQFAYFETNWGYAWKRPDKYLEYKVTDPIVLGTNVEKSDLPEFKKEGEAYIQVLFQEFLDY